MDTLKFSALSRALGLQAEDLQFKTKCLLDRVCTYWSSSKTLNRQISFAMENDELEINIPQCGFHCFSKTLIRFRDNSPISELTFYIIRNDERFSFAVFHINNDNEMTIPDRPETPVISIDYDERLENHFMDELVKSALKAQLL